MLFVVGCCCSLSVADCCCCCLFVVVCCLLLVRCLLVVVRCCCPFAPSCLLLSNHVYCLLIDLGVCKFAACYVPLCVVGVVCCLLFVLLLFIVGCGR